MVFLFVLFAEDSDNIMFEYSDHVYFDSKLL